MQPVYLKIVIVAAILMESAVLQSFLFVKLASCVVFMKQVRNTQCTKSSLNLENYLKVLVEL